MPPKPPAPDSSTARHPIRVVAVRTGLKPHVLRAWERRYAVVEPTRNAGGQRLYSDADVERLALMHRAIIAGRSISQVAGLSTAQLLALVAEDEVGHAREQRLRAAASEEATVAAHLEAVWTAVAGLAPARLEAALRHAFFVLGGPRLIERVLAPLLERVGREWEAGRLTPAHEHAASVVVRRLLELMVADMAPAPNAPAAVVAAPAGERHELGALLVAATAASAGWRVVYLGPDLPSNDIVRAARESDARLVAVSVVHIRNLPRVAQEISRAAATLRGTARVVIGGRAVRHLTPFLARGGGEIVTDLRAFRERLARPS
jgi:methanogenic corrinoid protein MtbC1